uniref:Uncharacterized protein n=1 Tax=Molossus molossus TaxID=27622 RepID=A0A7J8FZW0_MOLMO|nr:hypothetical protein HJG59_013639 [Molossus molossus]
MAVDLPFGLLILHLPFPPHCSNTLLWLRFALQSRGQTQVPHRVDLLCTIYCGHSHSEFPHLQPGKEEGKGSSEKN